MMIGIIFFGMAALAFLAVAWWLTDEVERLGQIAEQDDGDTL
jgi:hypothetical protein